MTSNSSALYSKVPCYARYLLRHGCCRTSSTATWVLSFQEDGVGVRLRDVTGVDNMQGSDYPHSKPTLPLSGRFWRAFLAGVPADEQARTAGGNTARVYRFDAPKPGARRQP